MCSLEKCNIEIIEGLANDPIHVFDTVGPDCSSNKKDVDLATRSKYSWQTSSVGRIDLGVVASGGEGQQGDSGTCIKRAKKCVTESLR